MGIKDLEKYASFFKLGQKTGIELLSEEPGTLAGEANYNELNERNKNNPDSEKKVWYLGNTLSAVIGQAENSFSPIQIARYISILTNGQKIIKPTLIKTIINPDRYTCIERRDRQICKRKAGIYRRNRRTNNRPKQCKSCIRGNAFCYNRNSAEQHILYLETSI